MNTILCNPTIAYEVSDLVGEGEGTEFFFDWVQDVYGKKLDLTDLLERELKVFAPSITVSEIQVHSTIRFVIALDDCPYAFEDLDQVLDPAVENFIFEYRLQDLHKYYELTLSALPGDPRGLWTYPYLAKRLMRTIPAYN